MTHALAFCVVHRTASVSTAAGAFPAVDFSDHAALAKDDYDDFRSNVCNPNGDAQAVWPTPVAAGGPAPPAPAAQPAATAPTYQDPFPSLLSRNSSLVDLAMIPDLDDGETASVPTVPGMNFVDFPQPEVDPSKFRAPDQRAG